jgi:hypothetical protein
VKNVRVHDHKRGCEGKSRTYQIKLPRRNFLLIYELVSRLAQARRQVHISRSIKLSVVLGVKSTGLCSVARLTRSNSPLSQRAGTCCSFAPQLSTCKIANAWKRGKYLRRRLIRVAVLPESFGCVQHIRITKYLSQRSTAANWWIHWRSVTATRVIQSQKFAINLSKAHGRGLPR